ncbi:MAG TPA: glycosyltransferase family 2 protein [Acidimicrobiia bacterium]
MPEQPTLDVIIPAARASGTVGAAIDAVRDQDYPSVTSIVVATSDRDTSEVAMAHGASVVPNPSGRTPDALNLALAAGHGEIVARVDAHSLIPKGYLTRAVGTLLTTGADNVGGMQIPVGDRGWARAIAAAMASPFGAGDARHRIGGSAGPAETVYLGVFRRAVLERLGGFDETFDRNQDYELNHRIRQAGGVVWFDPELRVSYRPRSSLAGLASQYFQYGQWKREFARRYPGSLRWRQLAPPFLVVLTAVSVVAGLWWPAAWAVPLGYLAALVLIGLTKLPSLGGAALAVPAALATMHLSWGLGFLIGPPGRGRTS